MMKNTGSGQQQTTLGTGPSPTRNCISRIHWPGPCHKVVPCLPSGRGKPHVRACSQLRMPMPRPQQAGALPQRRIAPNPVDTPAKRPAPTHCILFNKNGGPCPYGIKGVDNVGARGAEAPPDFLHPDVNNVDIYTKPPPPRFFSHHEVI